MRDLLGAQHHAGDRSRRLAAGVVGHAIFDGPGLCYRYRLERVWDTGLPTALFVMMNPSTASTNADDATIAKVTRMVRAWGYGRLLIGNVFAYRCTDQRRLTETPDPVGPANDWHLRDMAEKAAVVVMAYGTPRVAALRDRGLTVARALVAAGHPLAALELSNAGVPKHPLYLLETLRPQPWSPPDG